MVKSLVACCQETLTKYLDVLSEVGCIPYSLIKNSLVHATPQQLYRIEKANPGIAAESDELWLKHCLLYKDIRDDYEQGLYRDPKEWRDLYLNRFKENEKKRQLIKQKVKSQYSKIKNEKEKKSIKVLHGVVPTTGKRSYEAARRSTMSKLFQQTKKETDKIASIYHKRPGASNTTASATFLKPPPSSSTVIRIPKPIAPLARSHQAACPKFDLPPPPPSVPPSPLKHKIYREEPNSKRAKLADLAADTSSKRKKPVAMVNFDIFNELS